MPKAIVANIVSAGGTEVYEQRIATLFVEQKAKVKHLKKAIQHGVKEREAPHPEEEEGGQERCCCHCCSYPRPFST